MPWALIKRRLSSVSERWPKNPSRFSGAGGPDYRHFTLEGGPSKLRLGGDLPPLNASVPHIVSTSAPEPIHTNRQFHGRFLSLTTRLNIG